MKIIMCLVYFQLAILTKYHFNFSGDKKGGLGDKFNLDKLTGLKGGVRSGLLGINEDKK